MTDVTHSLLKSLVQTPLLIGDIPKATRFDRTLLEIPKTPDNLNLNQKLGHLYEHALSMTLDASSKINLLAHNVQVFGPDKRTIGELDFIIQEKRYDTYIHLELGVKFYLAYKTPAGWQFPGPNDRDNWPKKLARLQDHQLRLSTQPDAQDMLRTRYNIETITTKQLVYGCLFIPINFSGPAPRLEFMAEDARTGRWLYARQWNEVFTNQEKIYVIPKPLWPVMPDLKTKPLFKQYTAPDFIEAFRLKGAMFTTQKLQHTYFLAPDFWPATLLERQ